MFVVKSNKEAQMVMQIAMDAGEMMLTNGAEIYRVEDSMERMLSSCVNLEEIEVVCTYSSIISSFNYENDIITKITKIKDITTNLTKISEVNNFSRKFVGNEISLNEAMDELRLIDQLESINPNLSIMMFSTASAFFTLIVGGRALDALVTLGVVAVSQFIANITADQGRKYFMDTLISSLIISTLTMLIHELIVPIDFKSVIMGSIYLLFPGVSLTNSVRDFMNRDLLAGTIGLLQAAFVAAALAIGVGLVIYTHSQVI